MGIFKASGFPSSGGGDSGSSVSYETGNFVLTWYGFTSPITTTVYYDKIGHVVFLRIPIFVGVSNIDTFYATGIPAALRPAVDNEISVILSGAFMNGSIIGPTGSIIQGLIDSTGRLRLTINTAEPSGWTDTGNKGIVIRSGFDDPITDVGFVSFSFTLF